MGRLRLNASGRQSGFLFAAKFSSDGSMGTWELKLGKYRHFRDTHPDE